MAQDLPQGEPEDEAREEDIVDQLVRDQEVNGQNNDMSPEERRQLEDLGYQHLEDIPRPRDDGDWAGSTWEQSLMTRMLGRFDENWLYTIVRRAGAEGSCHNCSKGRGKWV